MGRAKKARGSKTGRTPVMDQFFAAKEQYPDALLFFRMGDFYELFYDDAIVAAEALDITLTSRGKNRKGDNIPMAGVPHHAAAGYLSRLLDKGFKVAICEQLADPKTVKGIVPRGVVRVETPGLSLDPNTLDAKADNYLVAVRVSERPGLAAFELSRADLRACVLPDDAALLAELARLEPREVLVDGPCAVVEETLPRLLPRTAVRRVPTLDGDEALFAALGEEEAKRAVNEVEPAGRAAAAMALTYAQEAQPGSQVKAARLTRYDPGDQLRLDEVAARNLELVRTMSGDKAGSLLALLDETKTSMGARLLRRRLLAPLTDRVAIRRRHDAVEALLMDADLRRDLRARLAEMADLERLSTRVELGVAHPRDVGAVRDTLVAASQLVDALRQRAASSTDDTLLALVPTDPCDDVLGMLETALVAEPPTVSTQGGIFEAGIDADLDEVRTLSSSSKDVLLQLEQREREQTTIGSLKIKYTKVFGYYIEVTRANLHLVPEGYRRKQTIANGERYVTEELEGLQAEILGADEKIKALESALFADLVARVADESVRLRSLARALSSLDVAASLAETAHRYDYVRPELHDGLELVLEECRHPIVERLAAAGTFVPNDVELDAEAERLMVITGPNMSGKSTAMRQVALAVVLAQMGSFVPARRARIGIVDRVFTRVGASDNLGGGQSTFMVEMKETATILRDATRRSLVILDEIGRGTSTYDGLAIAWAVAEHLHDGIGCRAMFATHYHELTELAELRDGIVSFNVAAREYGEEVVFLHKLVEGATNRSYGVAVARLAGVTEIVLARARAILHDLEEGAPLPGGRSASLRGRAQLELFSAAPAEAQPSEVERTLAEIDVDRLRPLDALVTLARLKAMLEPPS
ncbi:MAG: DNA mismatch repair protein MutS [Sandaracinaceae bacterium]